MKIELSNREINILLSCLKNTGLSGSFEEMEKAIPEMQVVRQKLIDGAKVETQEQSVNGNKVIRGNRLSGRLNAKTPPTP